MISNQRFLAVVAGAVLIMGCGSTDVTSPPVSVAAGTYIMTRVNGSVLPTNISDDRSPVWINSGSLTIESSGSFKSEVTYSQLSGENFVPTTDTCAGTYSRNSKGLVFSGPTACNGPTSATVDGSVVTALVNPSIRVEYKM
ncbi:MAG: hypothetical protein ABJC63_12625 [Gemmatimonadales bacterium]